MLTLMMAVLSVTSFVSLSMFLLILLFVSWFIFKQIEFVVRKTPPGPIGLPLLGIAPFLSKDIHKDIARLNRIYGKLCSVTVASSRFVLVSDYDTAKELLCHPATLSRPERIFDYVPGKAGFSAMNGKQWAVERKCALQALRNIGLGKELWDDIIREDVVKLMDYITAWKGAPMEVREPFTRSSMSNMLALVLGRRFLDRLSKDDFRMLFEANKSGKEQMKNFVIVTVFPWLQKYLETFNIAGFGERKKLVDALAELISNAIKERLNSTNDEDATDFILQYAKGVKKQTGCQTLEDASVECLLGNIVIFITTSDTAMVGTRWILYFMAADSKIQAKVHAEIDDVIGPNATISWEDRTKLPYTMACIFEMERWVAVVPIFVPRCVSETFEFHGYALPKGTIIIPNGWAINRDPKYWNRPDEYIPERFIGTTEEKLSKLGGYAPFSFGKRNCPGDKIAVMITYLYFTSIMQKFKVRTPSGEPPDLTPHFATIFEPKNQELCFVERE